MGRALHFMVRTLSAHKNAPTTLARLEAGSQSVSGRATVNKYTAQVENHDQRLTQVGIEPTLDPKEFRACSATVSRSPATPYLSCRETVLPESSVSVPSVPPEPTGKTVYHNFPKRCRSKYCTGRCALPNALTEETAARESLKHFRTRFHVILHFDPNLYQSAEQAFCAFRKFGISTFKQRLREKGKSVGHYYACLLYTSDAADE